MDIVGEVTAGGEFILRVADAGPGIATDDRARVAQPFQQADDGLARRHEGLGLGLYIVRVIAEGHGGRLSIGQSVQGGADVAVVLPPDRIVPTL